MTQFLLHRADRRYSPYDTDVADHTAATLGNASPAARIVPPAPSRRFLAVLLALCAMLFTAANATNFNGNGSIANGFYKSGDTPPATTANDEYDADYQISDNGATITIYQSFTFDGNNGITFSTGVGSTTAFQLILANDVQVDFNGLNISVWQGGSLQYIPIKISGEGKIVNLGDISTNYSSSPAPKIIIEGNVSVTANNFLPGGAANTDLDQLVVTSTGEIKSNNGIKPLSDFFGHVFLTSYSAIYERGTTVTPPNVSVRDDETAPTIILNSATDYIVSYNSNLSNPSDWEQAQKIEIICTGKGSYRGVISAVFEIIPKTITTAMIEDMIDEADYTSLQQKPFTDVLDESYTLALGTDYTVDYYDGTDATPTSTLSPPPNFTDADSCWVVITGQGNYAGGQKWLWKILPIAIELAAGGSNAPVIPTNLVYNGTAQQLVDAPASTPSSCSGVLFSQANTNKGDAPTYLSSGSYPSETNAGTYYVWIKYLPASYGNAANGDVGYNYYAVEDDGPIVIRPATPSFTWPSNAGVEWEEGLTLSKLNGASPAVQTGGPLGTVPITDALTSGAADVATDVYWTTGSIIPRVPTGNYSMTLDLSGWTATEIANYDWTSYASASGGTEQWDATNQKLIKTAQTLLVDSLQAVTTADPVGISSQLYNGYKQKVIQAGTGIISAVQGTFWYSIDNGTTWVDTIPEVKDQTGGTVDILWYVQGNQPNYKSIGSAASPDTLKNYAGFEILQAPIKLITDNYTISSSASAYNPAWVNDLTWSLDPSTPLLGEDAGGTNYTTLLGIPSSSALTFASLNLSTTTYPLSAGTTISNEVVFASGIPNLPSPSNYYISGTPIYGTVTVTSDPPIDVTVTLSTPAIVGQPITATLTYGGSGATSSSSFVYKWYADNVLIATTSTPTYTPTSAANGKIIEVVVTALNYTGQAVYSSTTNVGKNPNNSTPADPTEIAAQTTPTSITLTPLNNYEYSKDGGSTWQTSNVFTGLTQNTSYTFIQRIAETATMGPSANSNSLSVTTPDQNQYDCNLIKAWIEQLTIPAANYVSANTTAAVASFIQAHIQSLTLPTNTSGIVGNDITVNAGTSGTFTAAPQNNGNGSWANVTVVVAKGSKTATATIPSVTITYTPYTLTVVAATGGSATVTPSQTSYAFGTPITVVATPAHGQKFKQWDYTPSAPTGATSVTGTQTWGKTETLTFNMPSTNLTITARFEPDAAWVAADNQAAAASAATTATYSTPQQLGSGVTATSYHAIIQQMVNAKITSYGASAPAAGYTWLTYLAPVSGTESNPAGVNGYLDFTATITVSGVSTVTNVLRCEIVAAAYKPAQAPTIYRQPQYNTVVYASTSQLELSVKADLPADGGALSYVWYRNSVESNVGGTPLASSNSPTYKVSINEPGTWYYYVVITNTKNGNAGTNPSVATTAQIRSNTATVVVRPIVSPTNYMRPVNIKEANVKDFVTVSPRFGVHWISSRSDFSFTVHANDGYDLSGLTVKTDVPIEYTIEKSPAETDGSIATATVTLLFVNLEVNVTLDGVAAVGGSAGGIGGGETTGNAAIANSSLRVWSLDRDLYISGLQQGKAFNVYNIAGKLIYSGISSVGKTEHVRIPAAGIYLLKTDDKTVKAVVK